MAARGHRSKIDQIWPHKSHFGSAFGSCSSDLDKIWHEHTTWPFKKACARISHLMQNPRWPSGSKVQNRPNLTPQITFRLSIWTSFIRFWQNLAWPYFLTIQTSLCKIFSVSTKSNVAAWGHMSKINQIWPQKSHFGSAIGSRSSDLNKIWHEHTSWSYKQICARVISSCKTQEGRRRSKVQNRLNLIPQITFWLGILIPSIWFGQNWAWTDFLIIQISLRKNLSVGANSRWPPGIKGPKFASKSHISGRHLDPVYPVWTFDPLWPSWILR